MVMTLCRAPASLLRVEARLLARQIDLGLF
jgi:hypothetical protein